MLPPDAVALQLRFREPEPSLAPPDLEAFRRTPAVPVDELRRPEEIGVLVEGRQSPQRPIVVFLQHPEFAIPAIGARREPLPDLASWSVRPTVFGYLARVPPPRRRAPGRSRAWVVAAWLPLAVPAVVAAGRAEAVAAAPAKPKPPIQAPAAPSVPAPPGAGDEPEPAAAPVEVAPVEAVAPAEPVEAVAPAGPTEVAPALEPGEAPVDQATIDAAWEGVDGFDVELVLKGAGRMQGRVGAVQQDTFTLIQAETGAVLVLPKSGVVSLRVRMPGPLPTKTGTGAIAGGAVLSALGGPVFLSGVVFLGLCPSCTYIHLPMLIIGGGALGGGIPLIVRGVRARRQYDEAVQERALSPVVMRTPHGWSGGLRFRF